jgi:hypothetical protein
VSDPPHVFAGDWAPTFGTVPAAADTAAIIEYARLR